jgi:hypothetical protein
MRCLLTREERKLKEDTSALRKLISSVRWVPSYLRGQITPEQGLTPPKHLLFAVADHFEPSFLPEAPSELAPCDMQEQRLEHWCHAYPTALNRWRDSEGFPLVHTYFYPAEQYDRALIERLADHCHSGWGEIEVQLHHGVRQPDSAERTRSRLLEFIAALDNVGCLSRAAGIGPPKYAFVHGNWALANSAGGRNCGVDNEMRILADTGCYADFTLPSAPNPAQVPKINALYECTLPLELRAPHRKGLDLHVGASPKTFPLIFEGPLMLDFGRRTLGGLFPRIENSALTGVNPPSLHRLQLWINAGITVRGRPDWLFIKLHCHGMDPRDESAMYGADIQRFLEDLTQWGRNNEVMLHFLTARQMVNVALAACQGHDGNPSDYREFYFRLSETKAR